MSKRVLNAMNGVSLTLLSLALGLAPVTQANAQQEKAPREWEIPFGTPASDMPIGFRLPACGTNGGPPSTQLKSFEEFAKCPAEPGTGLHEVWFSYDDDQEYYLRAVHADPAVIQRFRANQLLDHLVINSLLFDDAGKLQGYRIVTDPGEDVASRGDADMMGDGAKVMLPYGAADWQCTSIPPENGQQPYGGTFENDSCVKVVKDVQVTISKRRYLKAGEQVARAGAPQPGEFESGSRIEAINASLAPKAAAPK